MLNKEELEQILNIRKSSITISLPLIKAIGTDAAVMYTYLLSKYYDNYKYGINNTNYFLCNVDDIENNLTYTPFKQRNILNYLEDLNLIKIKFGQARTRYIIINEDLSILKNIVYSKTLSGFETQIKLFINENKQLIEFINQTQKNGKSKNLSENLKNFGWLSKALSNEMREKEINSSKVLTELKK